MIFCLSHSIRCAMMWRRSFSGRDAFPPSHAICPQPAGKHATRPRASPMRPTMLSSRVSSRRPLRRDLIRASSPPAFPAVKPPLRQRWSSTRPISLAVTDPHSTENQVALACSLLRRLPREHRLFLFMNISALHQPNYFYLPGNTSKQDTLESHAAALVYVDAQLPPLFAAMLRHAPTLVILCSDHGTAYGEDGYYGHRLAHPVVWLVPYAEFVLPDQEEGV